MNYDLLINRTEQETRVALIKNQKLQEIYYHYASNLNLLGNIYWGKVQKILPGINAAFIDIGLEQSVFLHAKDIQQRLITESAPTTKPLTIQYLIHDGQMLLVQVMKDPIGTKSARVTTNISLPSRYLVMMPRMQQQKISQRITNKQERQRLTEILNKHQPPELGVIVRTVAAGVTEEVIKAEIQLLQRIWINLVKQKQTLKKVQRLYEEFNIIHKMIRDCSYLPLNSIQTDCQSTYQEILRFTEKFIPEFSGIVRHHETKIMPLFDAFAIEEQIQQTLKKQVTLPSGGYIIIEQTEAMVTIDVNTGSFVGHKNIEQTIVTINHEAATMIALQLRLRNLGGIIIIDFIDMFKQQQQNQVLAILNKALQPDRAKVAVKGFTSLGLVELTRERQQQSIEQVCYTECPSCQGKGKIKTIRHINYELLREIIRIQSQNYHTKYIIYVADEIKTALNDDHDSQLAQTIAATNEQIELRVNPGFYREDFEIIAIE